MARRVIGLLAFACLASACMSTARYPEAANQWQRGRYSQATSLASQEIARFRSANPKAASTAEAVLEAIDALLETPVVLADETPHHLLSAPLERAKPEPLADDSEEALAAKAPRLPRTTLGDALGEDLAADGALRVVRALRTVERLEMKRYGQYVLALAFRRGAWQADHPKLEDYDAATRSLAVKAAVERTLKALSDAK